MPAKSKKQQKDPSSRALLERIEKDQRKERKMMTDMTKKERLMKWLLIGVVILLLLLLLFAGYATDWLRGLSKDSAVTTAPATSLESPAGGAASESATTGAGNTGQNGTGSTGTSQTNDSTSKETSNTSTTTNNTTNDTTTTPSSGLLSLYTDSSVGDNIDDILSQASSLGITAECRMELLLQVCDFRDGDLSVTTRNLLGTGIVTSVTSNL